MGPNDPAQNMIHPALRLQDVSFAYDTTPTLRDLSLTLARGQFLTLLGPSGCGKSTLLKLIGGYLQPAQGTLYFGPDAANAWPPERRHIGMVFQNYALFPHLSAWQNVAFPLEVRHHAKSLIKQRVEEMLARVGLTSAEWHRRPAALSGGQQQRVALARALVFAPQLVLLDEPFANLDRHLHEQLRAELRRLHRETHVTTIMVTHDQEEALALSDVVGVMTHGRLLQLGSPEELYRRPRTPFVARFLGEGNIVPARSLGLDDDRLALVRPEDVMMNTDRGHTWSGTLESVTFQGADSVADVRCGGQPWRVRCRSERPLTVGDTLTLAVQPEAVWLMPERDEV